jgi:hypothetical protein
MQLHYPQQMQQSVGAIERLQNQLVAKMVYAICKNMDCIIEQKTYVDTGEAKSAL